MVVPVGWMSGRGFVTLREHKDSEKIGCQRVLQWFSHIFERRIKEEMSNLECCQLNFLHE